MYKTLEIGGKTYEKVMRSGEAARWMGIPPAIFKLILENGGITPVGHTEGGHALFTALHLDSLDLEAFPVGKRIVTGLREPTPNRELLPAGGIPVDKPIYDEKRDLWSMNGVPITESHQLHLADPGRFTALGLDLRKSIRTPEHQQACYLHFKQGHPCLSTPAAHPLTCPICLADGRTGFCSEKEALEEEENVL